jgi:hypothetical protein
MFVDPYLWLPSPKPALQKIFKWQDLFRLLARENSSWYPREAGIISPECTDLVNSRMTRSLYYLLNKPHRLGFIIFLVEFSCQSFGRILVFEEDSRKVRLKLRGRHECSYGPGILLERICASYIYIQSIVELYLCGPRGMQMKIQSNLNISFYL